MYEHLPGGDILSVGLKDLATDIRSVNGLLVLIGAWRLSRCGIKIPITKTSAEPVEHELYNKLVAEHGDEAYRIYKSLLARLVSLENALESQTHFVSPGK